MALCERYPGGVEVCRGVFWECRVRTPNGVRSGMAQRIEDAVEVVAANLGITKETVA